MDPKKRVQAIVPAAIEPARCLSGGELSCGMDIKL